MKYGSQAHLDCIRRRLEQKCKTRVSTSVHYIPNLERLRKKFGLSNPRQAKSLGFCFRHGSRFYVYIEKDMSFEIKAQTLVHEWAHLMTPKTAPNHGRKRAANYAKAYKVIYRVK